MSQSTIKSRVWGVVFVLACLAAVILFAINVNVAEMTPRGNFQITHLNLDRDNQESDSVVKYLESFHRPPDIVCLQEYTPFWDEVLRTRLTGYRWVEALPREDSRGSAMLMLNDHPSLKLIKVEVLQWLPGEQDRPTIAAEFDADINALPLVVVSMHAKRPKDRVTSDIQRREFQAAAAWCQRKLQGHHLIVIGDFNTTPWATHYRQFLDGSGLNHAGGTLMRGTTFPAGLPFPLRLPIDLCAVDKGVMVNSIDAGPDVGSDHRPLSLSLDMPGM